MYLYRFIASTARIQLASPELQAILKTNGVTEYDLVARRLMLTSVLDRRVTVRYRFEIVDCARASTAEATNRLSLPSFCDDRNAIIRLCQTLTCDIVGSTDSSNRIAAVSSSSIGHDWQENQAFVSINV
jgi:hypothetical protein